MMVVGDIGATKVLLEAGVLRRGHWQAALGRRYASAEHADFGNVLRTFLSELAAQRGARLKIARACFGVAGPVSGNRAQMTNLPWVVDGDAIAARVGIARVRVVNDFAAAARGIDLLEAADLVTLQSGEPDAVAPRLVIGAGTGLGVAYMIRAAGRWRVIAGEGGHAGFAPATPEQSDLWRDLYSREGRVAAEDAVSGPGLVRIYDFLCRRKCGRPVPVGGAPVAITHAALELGDALCSRAVDLFVSCFGAVAGDHALAVMARGGVYLTGGIAPKILPRLAGGGFCAAFNAKGVHSGAVRKIPVIAVTNEKLGLLGAALIASAR